MNLTSLRLTLRKYGVLVGTVAVIAVAIISMATIWFLQSAEGPVAPTAPESQPQAAQNVCSIEWIVKNECSNLKVYNATTKAEIPAGTAIAKGTPIQWSCEGLPGTNFWKYRYRNAPTDVFKLHSELSRKDLTDVNAHRSNPLNTAGMNYLQVHCKPFAGDYGAPKTSVLANCTRVITFADSPKATCSESCSADADCSTGLACIGNMCKNPTCSADADCTCDTQTTKTSDLVTTDLTCTNQDFTATMTLKENNVAKAGVVVNFTYNNVPKTATTNASGVATVTYTYVAGQTVTATPTGGYPVKSKVIMFDDECPNPVKTSAIDATALTCEDQTFDVTMTLKEDSVAKSGIAVSFVYSGETKTATTNASGVATQTFTYQEDGNVVATPAAASGYAAKTEPIAFDTDSCDEPVKASELVVTTLTCTNQNFDAKMTLKEDGVVKSGVVVKFEYNGSTKNATTNASGVAQQSFTYAAGKTVVATPEQGYPAQSKAVTFTDTCPTATPVPVSCNNGCSANSDCDAGLTCSGGVCRNPSCTNQSSCTCPTATPTATPGPVSCNNTCSSNAACGSGLICSGGVCRNPSCTNESDCTCAIATATPTPAPSCNNTCVTSNDCGSGLTCSNGQCRNPSCTNQTNCTCLIAQATATPVPVTKGGTPTPAPTLPVAGSTAQTVALLTVGVAVIGLGASRWYMLKR
jgi:hypothetical protein